MYKNITKSLQNVKFKQFHRLLTRLMKMEMKVKIRFFKIAREKSIDHHHYDGRRNAFSCIHFCLAQKKCAHFPPLFRIHLNVDSIFKVIQKERIQFLIEISLLLKASDKSIRRYTIFSFKLRNYNKNSESSVKMVHLCYST